jgi:hypothetical protein
MKSEEHWPKPQSWTGLTTNQRDFGQAVARTACLYSSAVILRTRDGSILHNASGFLLMLGDRTYLVTNHHVLKRYREIAQTRGDATFTFGGKIFEPEVVDEASDDRDVVTIDVTGEKFDQTVPGYWKDAVTMLQAYAPHSWPLAGPTSGEATVTVGWPGKHRASDAKGKLEFAAFPMVGQFVGDVTERGFAIPFDREFWISSDYDPKNSVVFETQFGGISGSPVFALHRPHIFPLQLIGVVREYGPLLDALLCTRADLIKMDGAIASQRSS